MARFRGVSARDMPKSTDRYASPVPHLHLSLDGLHRYTRRNNQSPEMRSKIRAPLPFSHPTLSVLIFVLSVGVWLTGSALSSQAAEMFSVINVAADDELNVRSYPSAEADKVGALPFNTTSVVATGLTRKIGRATWMEIVVGETKGWVNAAYLSAVPTSTAPTLFREPLACSGTEPFWALQIEGTVGDFDSLGEGKSTIEFISSRSAHGVPIIWSLRGRTKTNQSPVFALLEETNQCSDGMSDLTYRYVIRIDIENGPFYAGCCNPHPGQPAP